MTCSHIRSYPLQRFRKNPLEHPHLFRQVLPHHCGRICSHLLLPHRIMDCIFCLKISSKIHQTHSGVRTFPELLSRHKHRNRQQPLHPYPSKELFQRSAETGSLLMGRNILPITQPPIKTIRVKSSQMNMSVDGQLLIPVHLLSDI